MFLHPNSTFTFVSGGNRGIGLEVIRSILEHYARFISTLSLTSKDETLHIVFLGCRNLKEGSLVAGGLNEQYSHQMVIAVELDVTDAMSIKNSVEEVGKFFNTYKPEIKPFINILIFYTV